MRAAGGIEHASAGLVHEGARESVADPVAAADPGPVMAARGPLQPGLHGQQMADGDLPDPGICIGGNARAQDRCHRLLDALQDAALDGDADEGR